MLVSKRLQEWFRCRVAWRATTKLQVWMSLRDSFLCAYYSCCSSLFGLPIDLLRNMVQHGGYKTMCDGLAVRHANYSEFYDSGLQCYWTFAYRCSDIIFMDNPISGATTDLFAEDLLPPRLAHHFWVLRFAGEG